MVAGHLEVKKGYYYAVLSYLDINGKRHRPWIATGLPEKGNKRKAEAELARIRSTYEPPVVVQDLCSDMLFADYLLQWLEIVRTRVKITTYGSYEQMIKAAIVHPAGAGSKAHPEVLYREAEGRQAQLGDPLSRRHPPGPQVRGEDRPGDAKCGGESGQAQEERLSAGIPGRRGAVPPL